jgi:hypothetical protein
MTAGAMNRRELLKAVALTGGGMMLQLRLSALANAQDSTE